MPSEYADDMTRSELLQLIDDCSMVEEIPMARIRELCAENFIDCTHYHTDWKELVDSCHKLVAVAEDRMCALDEDEREVRNIRTGIEDRMGAADEY
jgi:hypothetical protein